MSDMKHYDEALQCQMTLQALAKEFNLLRKPGEPELGVAGVFGAVMQLIIDNERLKAYAPDPFDDSLPTYAQITKDLTETEFELYQAHDLLSNCQPHSLLNDEERMSWFKRWDKLMQGTDASLEAVKYKESANLGLATTQELLEELMARARTGGYDQYKTLNLEDKQ